MSEAMRLTYERTASRLLSLCKAPDVRIVRFVDGVRIRRVVKSKHVSDMARRWRMFWRLKRYTWRTYE